MYKTTQRRKATIVTVAHISDGFIAEAALGAEGVMVVLCTVRRAVPLEEGNLGERGLANVALEVLGVKLHAEGRKDLCVEKRRRAVFID